MSTDWEIFEVYREEIENKTNQVLAREGLEAFLRGQGMSIRKLDSNLNEVELFSLEEWEDNSSDED